MNKTELQWIEKRLGELAANGRVAVSSRGCGQFTLHAPLIATPAGADFGIRGKRRHHAEDGRTWRTVTYPVAKVLRVEKCRLVVMDIFGRVLTLRSSTRPWDEMVEG